MSQFHDPEIEVSVLRAIHERKEANRQGYVALWCFLGYMASFVLIIAAQRDVTAAHSMENALSNAFIDAPWSNSPTLAFGDCGTRGDVHSWFQNVVLPSGIFPPVNGQASLVQDHNMMVGSLVVSIRVQEQGSCGIAKRFSDVYLDSNCYGGTQDDFLDPSGGCSGNNLTTLFCGPYEPLFKGHVLLFNSGENITKATETFNQMVTDPYWIATNPAISRVNFIFIFYNGRIRQFNRMLLWVDFLPTGEAVTGTLFTGLDVEVYSRPIHFFRAAIEALFVFGLCIDLFLELRDIFLHIKRGTMFTYLGSFFTWVQLISISFAVVSVSLWIHLQVTGAKLQLVPEYLNENPALLNEDMRELLDLIERLAAFQESYMQFNTVVLVCFLLRVIKVLNFQPQMALMTNTVITAAPLLAHFLVLLLIVFFGFGFLAFFAFGDRIEEYRTMWESILQSFSLVNGGMDWTQLIQVRPVLGPLFFLAFSIIITYLLMQMLLAIILDAFSEVKSEADLSGNMFAEVGAGIGGFFEYIIKPSARAESRTTPNPLAVIKWVEQMPSDKHTVHSHELAHQFNIPPNKAAALIEGWKLEAGCKDELPLQTETSAAPKEDKAPILNEALEILPQFLAEIVALRQEVAVLKQQLAQPARATSDRPQLTGTYGPLYDQLLPPPELPKTPRHTGNAHVPGDESPQSPFVAF